MARNIIGERVRLARKRAEPHITQLDLAARLQVQGIRLEQAAISKIEAGTRDVTDIEIVAIAEALDVPVSWLFGKSENNRSEKSDS